MIYERRHSRLIADFGGIAAVMPAFAALLTFVSLSSIGLPATNGFVGEFLVLLGSFQTHPAAATIATTAVIFAAAYLLWALKRLLYGPLTSEENRRLTDLTGREYAILAPLVILILWLGLYPQPVLRRTEPAVRAYTQWVEHQRQLPLPRIIEQPSSPHDGGDR
jgi:NADH-quinone oxidoreductase subunit M